jgi:hypothetical protein
LCLFACRFVVRRLVGVVVVALQLLLTFFDPLLFFVASLAFSFCVDSSYVGDNFGRIICALLLRSCSACAAKSASVVDVDASSVVDVDVVVVDIVVDVDAVVADDVVVVVVVADGDVAISDCCRGFLCLRFFFDSSCEVKAAPASVSFRFALSSRLLLFDRIVV